MTASFLLLFRGRELWTVAVVYRFSSRIPNQAGGNSRLFFYSLIVLLQAICWTGANSPSVLYGILCVAYPTVVVPPANYSEYVAGYLSGMDSLLEWDTSTCTVPALCTVVRTVYGVKVPSTLASQAFFPKEVELAFAIQHFWCVHSEKVGCRFFIGT